MRDIMTHTDFNIYLLYPTDRDNEANFYRLLRNYTNIGTEIQAYLIDWEKMDDFPKSKLYVPADHEIFMQCAYLNNLLTKEQISFINCEIIKLCDLLVLFGGYKVPDDSDITEEVLCAKHKEVPVYTMPDLSPMAIDALKLAIKLILKSRG